MPELAFPIIDATEWPLVESEQLGTKEKVWVEDPDGESWLFKQVRADDRGGVRGEDWAEKLAAEVAVALRLPAAEVELAVRPFAQGLPRGVLSRYMLPEGHALTHGNELLGGRVAGYAQSRTGEVPGYTVATCMEALDAFDVTPNAEVPDGADARFLFAGYLVLDALVANTDRHHENWGVVQTLGRPPYIAPTFDHASSLGFQEPQDRKQRLLDIDSAAGWTTRARTKFEGKPHPIEVARQALGHLPRLQADEWRERVKSVSLDWWRATLERVPDELMSQVDRNFAYNIVRLNQEVLLDVC
ncbi:HipA domain-containing protein [Nitriliruptor alkaliphilus]|uniref:HipA domain-containing protein n=1 Tax=Nitriliruptor alkaliphilus TaxID=427918 RepID=UPI000698337D|nr:HipA domain-containing protein [Nitriliruptor alkaliphilus]